jgi:hypothetical protein
MFKSKEVFNSVSRSIKRNGLSMIGGGMLLMAGVREAINPSVTLAQELQPDFGITLNCATGVTTVWMKDFGHRRLVLEMNNISADKKGIVGEEKPEHRLGIGIGGVREIPSNNGNIPVQDGDVVILKALKPTEDPEKPQDVGQKSIEVSCD